jgi:hypothetical protein
MASVPAIEALLERGGEVIEARKMPRWAATRRIVSSGMVASETVGPEVIHAVARG